jgi:uncharacterized protein (TIGR03437 family)
MMMKQRSRLVTVVTLALGAPVWAQNNVLTANYGNARTNANLSETVLTPGAVDPSTFGKLGSLSADGQVYAQPLVVSNLTIPGRGARNVVYVCTQHNSVYAFDAGFPGGVPLWQVNLGPAVPNTILNFNDITPEVGILGTPVIDPAANALYVVSDTLNAGAPAFMLHALDLRDGHEVLGGPTKIAASVTGSGDGSQNNVLAFDAMQNLQRPGLLLSGGVLYLAFGSHADASPFHGWLLAYDASNIARQIAAYNSTPNGAGGSFWQGGRGPAADDAGNIYVVTGNGGFDGTTEFGESALKLAPKTLALLDWFTPFNWFNLSGGDFDLGSSGMALVPNTNLLVTGSKFGEIYVLDRTKMGHFTPGDGAIVQQFTAVEYGGIFNFAIWDRPDGALLYVQAQSGPLRAYRLTNGRFDTNPAQESTVMAVDLAYEGIALSAGGGSGVVWLTSGDHNQPDVPGTLHAFDASDLKHELWNSDMNPADKLGAFAKFAEPTVVNGKVYVPTFSGEVDVYGILPGAGDVEMGAVTSGASFQIGSLAPGEIVALFGSGIGPTQPSGAQLDSAGRISTLVSGTRVLFDGVPASLLYVSSSQVTAVVPFGVARPSTQIQVEFSGQLSQAVTAQIADAAPALFTLDSSGSGPGAIINEDGTLNTANNPAARGSVVSLYGTGTGQTNPPGQDGQIAGAQLASSALTVAVSIGGQDAPVLYAGTAPGAVWALTQVNARIPANIDAGAVAVVLRAGDAASQAGVTVFVK